MLLHSASRLRSAISAAILTSFLVLMAAVSHAQASSQAIASLQALPQQDRVMEHPNFTPLTQLDHQLPGWVGGRPQSSAHAIDLSTPLRISLVLNRDPAVQAAFDKFLADQQTPGSPLYHRWLTPRQVGNLFGPTPRDLTALTVWLTSQGLKVDSIAPNAVIVHASGSAALVGNAFHTTFAMFSPDDGLHAAPRLSAVSEPFIPSVLVPLVRSIQGLAQIEVKPLNFARPVQRGSRAATANESAGVQPLFTDSRGDHFITPGDFGVIFNVNSVYHVGNIGAKIGSTPQRIAVIGESRVTNTDVTEFEQLTGLNTYIPNVVIPTGATDPGTTADGGQDEATLDVDRVIATAPGAGVDLVIAKDTATEGGIFIAAEYNVTTLLDPIMTISFGGCEAQAGLSNTDFVNALAAVGAAEGITTLVSSGDSGAAGCDTSFKHAPANQTASINFICSSSYVTCVGGTEFNDQTGSYWGFNTNTLVSALSYIPEGAWNEPADFDANTADPNQYAPAASGGGVSTFIAKPTWQSGTGVPSGSFRFVPDVALPASQHDGYFACLAFNGGDCNNNAFEAFSGTSAAAPGFAGIVALINTQVGTSAGNINPLLYALAASTPSAFHDTTIASSGVTSCVATTPSMCNNSTPGPATLTGGLSGNLLTTGYDEVTGLGSVDVGVLVANASVPAGGGAGSFALSPSPSAISVTPVASTTGTPNTGTVTSTITATSVGNFAGSVALTCSVATTAAVTPTCAVSPASLTLAANGAATSKLTISYVGPTSGCVSNAGATPHPMHIAYLGPASLALLLLLLPYRRRKSMRNLACIVLLVGSLASLSGCGGSSSKGGGGVCSNVVSPGTTPGTYTVTVTGTAGSDTQTAPVIFTVN